MSNPKTHHVPQRLSLSERFHYAVERARGIPILTDLASYESTIDSILATDLRSFSDDALRRHANELRNAAEGRSPQTVYRRGRRVTRVGPIAGLPEGDLAEWFALSSECAHRVLGERPYPVQLAAGLALAEGKLVQMKTGEGKTLAAVPAAVVGSLSGEGVHVFTANDYLARRDAEWMGDIYRMLGCTVASITDDTAFTEKRAAYRADITYLTARRAGFDFLTDQMAYDVDRLVQRPPGLAIVDEADSILIDEARVPLVIARERPGSHIDPVEIDRFAATLQPEEHYTIDRAGRICVLSVGGQDAVQAAFGCSGMGTEEGFPYYAAVNVALHARHLLSRDKDYIVRNDAIELVDEFTGRVAEDRKWPYGIQTALEAKEEVPLQPSGEVCGSITTHYFIARYPRLAAMTATAVPSARELKESYGLDTVIIPPNRPDRLQRDPDRVFTTRDAKMRATMERIVTFHAAGRPVLVGTTSVAESEELAEQLRTGGVECSVLNARNDEEEAAIIAEAGRPGAVTVSTNMAGRGTDIRLGGVDEAQREDALAAGGLYVIGTNRHESRRIDEQLAGRAGRQGDPGGTCTMVSLEDEIVTKYAIAELLPREYRSVSAAGAGSIGAAGPPADADLARRAINDGAGGREIHDPVVAKEILRAQSIIEEQHHTMRRTLRRYAEVVERQRRTVERLRSAALVDGELPPAVLDLLVEREIVVGELPGSHVNTDARPDAQGSTRCILARCYIASLDDAWAEFLEWTGVLREGIHLRRYAGRDPYFEFIDAAVDYFDELIESVAPAAVDRYQRWLADHRESAAGEESATSTTPSGATASALPGSDLEPASTWTYLISDDPFPRFSVLQIGSSNVAAAFISMLMAPVVAVIRLAERMLGRKRDE